MKRRYQIIIIGIGILVLAAVGMTAAVNRSAQKQAAGIEIQMLDASDVSDGTYEGQYEAESVKATVSISVADEKITNITILEHENGLGKKAEGIVPEVLDKQSLDVDAISGATVSSKTILKAIENALLCGKE